MIQLPEKAVGRVEKKLYFKDGIFYKLFIFYLKLTLNLLWLRIEFIV